MPVTLPNHGHTGTTRRVSQFAKLEPSDGACREVPGERPVSARSRCTTGDAEMLVASKRVPRALGSGVLTVFSRHARCQPTRSVAPAVPARAAVAAPAGAAT
jgi:hypothetical protein